MRLKNVWIFDNSQIVLATFHFFCETFAAICLNWFHETSSN